MNSLVRGEFERMFGNRKVHLDDKNQTSCYVSANDYKKLEPESVMAMHEKRYAIVATLKTRSTLDGGCMVAIVIDTMRVFQEPHFHK